MRRKDKDKELITNDTLKNKEFMTKKKSVSNFVDSRGFATNDAPVGSADELANLSSQERMIKFFEMGLNSTIASVLNLSASLLLSLKWSIKKDRYRETPKENIVLFRDIIDDMDNSWYSKVENIASVLQYGWCAFEIVLKKREDGRIGIKDLLFIPQWSVKKWNTDNQGNIIGFTQEGNSYNNFKEVFIPIEKILIITNTCGGTSIEGKSLLTGAYQDWLTFDITEKSLRSTIRRSFVGMPVIKIPGEIIRVASSNKDSGIYSEEDIMAANSVYNSYKEMLDQMRVSDDAGFILPSDTYISESGAVSNVECYNLSLLSLNGQPLVDINAVRVATEARMARVMQGDFLQMGTSGKTGTYSLGNTRYEMFARSINVLADKIVEEINKHLFRMLGRYNNIPNSEIPVFVHTKANEDTLKNKIDAIAQYQYAGGTLLPDLNIDAEIRRELEFADEIQRPEGWMPAWERDNLELEKDRDVMEKDNPEPSPGKNVKDSSKRTRPAKNTDIIEEV